MAKLVVVGGGITAWSAAAAVKRRIPCIDVTLVETPPAADAIADHIISTLPSIGGFHHDIGLTDVDAITGAGSGLRLGTLLEGWAERQPDYVHAYGPCGTPVSGVAFHQLWLRHYDADGVAPFDRFSPSAELARLGAQSASGAEATGFGLQLTLERYREMMRAYALHLGVTVRPGDVVEVALRPADGFIENVVLADGSKVGGDVFVDCTGPAALLHRRMESPFIDWSTWLPCDRMNVSEAPPDPAVGLMDRVTALPFGWRWAASSPRKGSIGTVFSSAHVGDDPLQSTGEARRSFELRQGRRRDFWVRNCVAIGDAAITVEPLEWTNLHLVHSQIDRLVTMMPGADCADVEIAQFNRECTAEADRVCDYLCLHYVCSARTEPFWTEAAKISPPPTLAHTLACFRERGRLPYYQEETFSRDCWLTVLLGQGVRPRRIDPLADLVSPQEAAKAFATSRES